MEDARENAQRFFELGYRSQMAGEVQTALAHYTQSIELCPTPEAYTFRGWAYSFLGDYESAIEECKQAIALDPEYGNPYNDIGAYLIERGEWAGAIPWLEQALRAGRYASPFFALFNLGRVCEHLRRWAQARGHYQQALAVKPGYAPAVQALRRMAAKWN